MNAETNPLPCGCGIMGTRDLNREATKLVYRDLFVQFCPLHKAAPDMLEALKDILPLAEAYLRKAPNHPLNVLLEDARIAIAAAEEKP